MSESENPDRKKYWPKGSLSDGKVAEGDDLRVHTKATLKDYLKEQSWKNHYTIPHVSREDHDTGERTSQDEEYSIYPSAESTTKISTMVHKDDHEGFLSVMGDSVEANEFRKLSDSGQFADGDSKTLRDFFDKTERGPGHSLLSSVVPNHPLRPPRKSSSPESYIEHYRPDKSDAPEQQKRVSSILKNHNRFNPTEESPYLNKAGGYSTGASSLGTIQPALGINSLNTPSGNLSILDVRQVGLDLIARQSGHQFGYDHEGGSWSKDIKNYFRVVPGAGFFDNRVSSTSLLASQTSVGQEKLKNRPKLIVGLDDSDNNVESMVQKSVVDGDPELNDDYIKGLARDNSINFSSISNGGKSYGAAFNHLESFTGNTLAHSFMIIEGLVGTMTVGLVMGLFLELLYGEFEDDRAQGKDPASLRMGKWTDAPEAELAKHGIPYLKYPVFNSIASGLLSLFGLKRKYLPERDGVGGYLNNFITFLIWMVAALFMSTFDFMANLSKNKGFYVVLIRTAMRDNHKLLEQFTNPLSFIADLLKEVAMAAITGQSKKAVFLSIIEMFTSLSSFKFFMTLALMGDKVYEGEISDFSGLHQPIDLMPDSGQTRIYKSRVNKMSNALAWRHRSSPAMMWLPGETFGAMEMMGGTPSAAIAAAVKVGDAEGTESFKRRVVFHNADANTVGRFNAEDVLEMENQLEAEYMPFYFHDLRTNEIISFHAFITDIKDSYSSEYSDAGGFGRVDSVKIYKKTTRSISLSFWVLSTSQEDFDSMWFSINKLTQMVYPQWSMGRAVKASDTTGFVMPNSQIMTSSPLIRLRVGDFIRSNGSRFNLAKLFGIQEPATHLGDKLKHMGDVDGPKIYKPETIEDVGKEAKKTIAAMSDAAMTVADLSELNGKKAILKMSTTHGYVSKRASTALIPMLQADPPLFSVWTRCDGIVKIEEVQTRPDSPKSFEDKRGESSLTKHLTQFKVKFADPNDPANPYKGKDGEYEMFVLLSDLKPIITEAQIKPGGSGAYADAITELDIDSATDGLPKFLSADTTKGGNPIFQAARSTAGRGLAGFITSLDFDYADATYETTSLTRRAPKMVKVSISFAPIHDIAPGMDNMGGMRAPLYPVGDIMSHLSQDPIRNLQDYGFKSKSSNSSYGQVKTPALFDNKTTDPRESFDNSASSISKPDLEEFKKKFTKFE